MPSASLKLYFNDQGATPQQLDSFETVTVKQEMDMGWVATLEAPLCINAKGVWTDETETWFQVLNRLRIEVAVHGGSYVPLIDVPITACHYEMQMEPGKSWGHVEVHDDSFLLHRNEAVHIFTGISDDQIAQQVFAHHGDVIKTIRIDPVPPAPNLTDTTTVLRGTPMQLLHKLVRRHHYAWHAFVLPGPQPHTSIGCFQQDPKPTNIGLANMVLTGNKQNVLYIRPSSNAASPTVHRGGSFSQSGGNASVDFRTADLSQIQRLGTDPPAGAPAKRMLRPGQARDMALDTQVKSASQSAAYALLADGAVLEGTYPAVLQPYQNVQVTGTNGKLSGTWLVSQVTHTITRNSYGQTFSLKRNAQSSGTGSSNVAVPTGIQS